MGTLKELNSFVSNNFQHKKVIIASKSEPYSHFKHGIDIKEKRGVDGLVTALDPVMRSVKGLWVAFSFADTDFEVTDPKGRIKVPIRTKDYTLKRVKLNTEENQAMINVGPGSFWPLCHISFVRPLFIDKDWQVYKKINKKIADSILAEIEGQDAVVWLQDYHLVLCAKYIKEKRPDITVGLFWHIPWPDWEIFIRNPWGKEMIDGLLYNDLIGFHTKRHCSNFIRCCQRTHEVKVDIDYKIVKKGKFITKVLDFPISINFDRFQAWSKDFDDEFLKKIIHKFDLRNKIVAISTERFVYTKSIKEKIKAVDLLLQRNPQLVGKFVLLDFSKMTGSYSNLQVGVDYHQECIELAEKVNIKYRKGSWVPIRIIERTISQKQLAALYRISEIGLIVPVHDGMNLVAKEYVASHDDLSGVLVLSRFAGAAVEMKNGAILVNPYSINELVHSLEKALKMPAKEKKERMKLLRDVVRNNDVFDWAKSFFKELHIIGSKYKSM